MKIQSKCDLLFQHTPWLILYRVRRQQQQQLLAVASCGVCAYWCCCCCCCCRCRCSVSHVAPRWARCFGCPSTIPIPVPTTGPTQSIKPPAINQISPNIIRDGKSNETVDWRQKTVDWRLHSRRLLNPSLRLRGQRVKLWKMNAWNALLIVLMLRFECQKI